MKVEDFGPFTLSVGAHHDPSKGMCVMEMVSFLAGEEWSDTPLCSSPVVAQFCQILNDRMGQSFRDRLQTYVPRLIGTASPEHEEERAEYLAWQAITVFAPIALDAAGMHEHAKLLRDFDRSKGLKAAVAVADEAAAAAAVADEAAAAAAHAAARATAAAAAAAAHAAAHADDAATAVADAVADADAVAVADAHDAAFDALDGLLAIGPSGAAYTEEHLSRLPALREALTA